jgi:exopolysaccharide production protein ExoZ
MSKLPNIQILRALAAFSVVVYHSGIESTSVCNNTNQGCTYDIWVGGYGVGLFFLISGFIMVATSWNSFGKPRAALDFMRRRLIRIVPLYWLLTTIAVVGVFFVPTMLNVPVLDPLYVAASYLFIPVTRVNGLVRPIANLGWTLNLEMMFYVVFTVSLFFTRRVGLFLSVGFLLAFTVLQTTGLFAANGAMASIPLNFWADPIILNFIVGMIVAVFYVQGARCSQFTSYILIAVSIILSYFAYLMDATIMTYPENHIISRLANGIPAVFLFLGCTMGPQLNQVRTMWRGLLLIGDASYSLYLIHPFALRAFGKIWTKAIGRELPVWSFTIACLMLALAIGLICYYVAERPLLNYFNRFLPHRKNPVTALNPLVGPAGLEPATKRL